LATQVIPIKDLGLQPGYHKLRVSVDSPSHDESKLSDMVPIGENIFITISAQLERPTIYINDGYLYFINIPHADHYTLFIGGEEKFVLPLEGKYKPQQYLDYNIRYLNLDQIDWLDGTPSTGPGMKFICIQATADDSKIYLDSDRSNYLQYYVRQPIPTPINPETGETTFNLKIKSAETPNTINFIPAEITTTNIFEPTEIINKVIDTYNIYLNDDRFKTLFGAADPDKAGYYYIDLANVGIPTGIYRLKITAIPPSDIIDKFSESKYSNEIEYSTGGANYLLDKDGKILIDSADNYLCVADGEEVKKLTKHDLELIRYKLDSIFLPAAA